MNLTEIFKLIEPNETLEFKNQGDGDGVEVILFKQFPPSYKTYYQAELFSLNQLDMLRSEEGFLEKLVKELRNQIIKTKEQETPTP